MDLDDTLWDAGPVLAQAEIAQYAWLRNHAPRIADAYSNDELQTLRWKFAERRPDIAHDFTALRLAFLRECLEEHGYDRALAEPAVKAFVSARSRVTLFVDVVPSLSALRKYYRLIALTNGNVDVEIAGVADFFDDCISPAESGVQKPDSRMFELASRRAGVDPAVVVHVGDHPVADIEGAHRARMSSVWVNRDGAGWPSECRPAHAEISSLSELAAAVVLISQSRLHPVRRLVT